MLKASGAPDGLIDALLTYTAPPAPDATQSPPALPFADEPHATAWAGYVQEAETAGAVETLRRHFVQLRFPVATGMSTNEAYRQATRRGNFDAASAFAPGLAVRAPETVSIAVHQSMGGAVPVIIAGERDDFVALVQALTSRNEPTPVPDSMGACLVRGLNNWSRVADYRRAWEASRSESDDATWAEEFARLVPNKPLYQDRLVILSTGAYSAVPTRDTDLNEQTWLDRSLVIRREHEFTHYFTYRCFGTMRDHALDELVADCVGLLHAYGRYPSKLALRFLGLDKDTGHRPGGRLENYLASSKLPADGLTVVRALVRRAAANLEALTERLQPSPRDLQAMGRLTHALSVRSLEELASEELVEQLSEAH